MTSRSGATAFSGNARRAAGARQADRRPQLKRERVLVFRNGDPGFECIHGLVRTRRIEPQQTFTAQPINLRQIKADARLVDGVQDRS